MGLLDATELRPPSKLKRRLIMVAVFIVLGSAGLWWLLRYHTEKVTVFHFLSAVEAGNLQRAYGIWKPVPSYTFDRFLEDWGPNGYYGPVKSFNVKDTDHPSGCSCVDVIVQISPFHPFPEKDDFVKQAQTKEFKLRVEYKDQSIGFPLD
ncbi:MAG TPA: hypothetical protein VEJ46_07580 [Candidatus Acidoferrum sp.]|nr:hypothetical protein [Candidatus Acidoferrum sp.]